MEKINWEEFKKVDIRVGTIIEVKHFPEAIKPAYQLKIDLGEEIGIKQSSAQITELYSKKDLIGQQVIVVVNLYPKQIGSYVSDCLVTGFYKENKTVVLAVPDSIVVNGTRLA